MLRDLRIENFRGFRQFSMSGLARINLLVGTNNCGKTSVLEAIHLLSTPGNPTTLWQAQLRRGEFIDSGAERQVDIARLVYGYSLEAGSGFQVGGAASSGNEELAAVFVPRAPGSWKDIDDNEEDEGDGAAAPELLPPLALQLDWSNGVPSGRPVKLPITRRGGLRDRAASASRAADVAKHRGPVVFIGTDGMTREGIVSVFDSIVLTPDEKIVLQALHTIEPTIERIASVGGSKRYSWREGRGGIVMMVAGKRVPIGSLGGRHLALARNRAVPGPRPRRCTAR